MLGQETKLYLYTAKAQSTEQLSVTVPFTQNSKEAYEISVAVDLNQDGQISDKEWQVKNSCTHLVQNLKNNFSIFNETKKLAVGNN